MMVSKPVGCFVPGKIFILDKNKQIMAKYLTLFDTHSSYEEYIDGPDAILPNVSYCKDVEDVHFNPNVPDAIYLWKTSVYYPLELDEEYAMYDGTYDFDGETYYKWKKFEEGDFVDIWILTDRRKFPGIGKNNPYTPVGLILNDEFSDEYIDFKVYSATTEMVTDRRMQMEHHDTSGLDANGHDYVDLGLPSGTLWATMNVGASAITDYGDYYSWGELATKSDYSWNTYRFGSSSPFSKYDTDGKTELELADDVVRNEMGGGWHMPSNENLHELMLYTTNEWTTVGGINGRRFTSTVNGNSIFIPAAGYYYGTSSNDVGTGCYLWSSSLRPSRHYNAIYLDFASGGINVYYFERCLGFCVRGVLY